MHLPAALVGALVSLTAAFSVSLWGLVTSFAATGIEITGPTIATGSGVSILAGGYVYIFKKFLNGEWVVRDVARAETAANERVDKVTAALEDSTKALKSCNVQSEAHRDLIREMADRLMEVQLERRRVDLGHDPDRRSR